MFGMSWIFKAVTVHELRHQCRYRRRQVIVHTELQLAMFHLRAVQANVQWQLGKYGR
jgi:hypothetical protein